MEVFRISSTKYAKRLTASGKSARWNKDNQFVIYTGQYRSLSTLEMVVHKSSVQTKLEYEVMIISIPDEESLFTRLKIDDLPKNWRETEAYPDLQNIGGDWYEEQKTLILQVPSVIIPQEYNYVINTTHPDFAKIVLVRNENFFWDERLL